MAYVTKETTAKIRKALKDAFPQCRFSIRKENYCALNVTVLKSPYWDDLDREMTVNQYHIDVHTGVDGWTKEQAKFLKKVDEIIRVAGDHYDRSDIMTDYFDCAFYYSIHVGSYAKPHQHVEAK